MPSFFKQELIKLARETQEKIAVVRAKWPAFRA